VTSSENRLADNWPMLRPWIGALARLVLGVVWIWAAFDKLANPRTFVQAVRAYDATPEWLSKAIGYGLPVLELCLGIVLVIGITVRIAAAVSTVLLVVFLIGIIQASARGISIECGCFGGGGTTDTGTNYTWDIIRDLLLLAAAVFLVLWPLTHWSLEYYLARHDYVAPPSAKRMRTPEGRRRYEAQVAAKRASAKSRNMYATTTIVIVAALVTLVGGGVQAGRAKITDVVAGKHATATNGVVFGKKAAATVDVYEDFGCPVCEQFEADTHVKLEKEVRANLAQVRYHTMSILDRNSPNSYSTRAANAAICASDVSVEVFLKYHDILYGKDSAGAKVQPAEGTAGPGNTKLIGYGKQAGMTTAQVTTFSDCVTSEQYKPLVLAQTDKASQRGINSTPTVVVNGKQLADHNASTLFNAITKANVGHTPVPSKTPTPTPKATVSPSTTSSPSTTVSPSTSPSASTTTKKSASSSASPST
jgi:protein-disulfide isomerase